MIKSLSQISYIKLYYTAVFLLVTIFIILALLMQSHFRETSARQKTISLAYSQAQLDAANFRVNLQQVRYLFERNVNQSTYSLESINASFKKIRKQLKPVNPNNSSDAYQNVSMAYTAFYNAANQQDAEESGSDSVRIMYDSCIRTLEEVLDNAYFLSQHSRLNER